MKTFSISGKITISVSTLVDAETEEEAMKIARDRDTQQIPCDSFYSEDEFWCASELDGTPFDLRIDDAKQITP